MKYFIIFATFFMLSCSSTNKSVKEEIESTMKDSIPECLKNTIKEMSVNPAEGSPVSVTRYDYKGKRVYYLVAPCCDKYNIVYDSACHILGFPDGGFTGRGDGKMTDFKNVATNGTIVWQPAQIK